MGFNYDTWGGSWGTSWGSSWGTGVTPPTPTIDTHDGFDERKRRAEDFRQQRETLRRQLREAFDGPQQAAVQEIIAPYAEPNVPIERLSIDWDAFSADVAAIERFRAEYAKMLRRAAIMRDDEEVLMLL